MSKKITDLTALTTPDSTDVVPIVDISASTTKKTTVGGLLLDGSVSTAKLADGSVTNVKLSTSAGEPGATWTSYTPTWASSGTQPAIGNGTKVGRYTQIGKTVFVSIKIVMGSTTTYGTGSYSFSLPFASANNDVEYVGSAFGFDTGTAYRHGAFRITANSSSVSIFSDGATSQWAATVPHTWANTDVISITAVYEVA